MRNVVHPRLLGEQETIRAMVRMFCRARHGTARGHLCTSCRETLAYARVRIEHCRFGANKPVCSKCPVHCFQSDMRSRMREIMRYAGPRMMWRHPILAWRHMQHARRPVPQR